jgi:hypothetical protein
MELPQLFDDAFGLWAAGSFATEVLISKDFPWSRIEAIKVDCHTSSPIDSG